MESFLLSLPIELLWHIVYQFDSPAQFVIFSQVCRQTARVTEDMREWARRRFLVKRVVGETIFGEQDAFINVFQTLPCGKMHGTLCKWGFFRGEPQYYALVLRASFEEGILNGPANIYPGGISIEGQFRNGMPSGLWTAKNHIKITQHTLYNNGHIVCHISKLASRTQVYRKRTRRWWLHMLSKQDLSKKKKIGKREQRKIAAQSINEFGAQMILYTKL